ncbi:hypothetical protein PoB_003641300 [Plakobranchus ocellatus]|uniref:Uncharacterized protein n=1 Tax=Plakobranchus ocellatus TaxID=259542 RepID=A0AAV4ARC3_9GAST|nr:hypothetical protein PoB_003641300 [Plakobranchus ocellatus]
MIHHTFHRQSIQYPRPHASNKVAYYLLLYCSILSTGVRNSCSLIKSSSKSVSSYLPPSEYSVSASACFKVAYYLLLYCSILSIGVSNSCSLIKSPSREKCLLSIACILSTPNKAFGRDADWDSFFRKTTMTSNVSHLVTVATPLLRHNPSPTFQ